MELPEPKVVDLPGPVKSSPATNSFQEFTERKFNWLQTDLDPDAVSSQLKGP